MKSSTTLRRALLTGAASLALFACSDTSISSPGAVGSPVSPPASPPPAAGSVDLVPANFDASSPNLEIVEITTAEGNTIEVVQVSGILEDDITFLEGVGYFADETIFVGTDAGVSSSKVGSGKSQKPDAEITFEPGATLYFEGSSAGLVVTRGSRIIADGTADEPIIFSSIAEYERQNGLAPANPNARGEWLGLVINGFAPINNCNSDSATPGSADCEDDGEASSGLYGGDDAADDSGILDFVRVEHAGVFFTEEDQSNGIAFQAVGSGTQVSNIQVHNNGDDGVEFFGGTVDVANLVITGASDDSIDWTDGWTGSLQRVLVIQSEDSADFAIEADNRSTSAPDTLPRSNPTIANFTFIGNPEERAIRLREGTGATLVNGIVSGFSSGLVFGDEATADLLTDGPSGVDGAEVIIASHLFNNTTDIPDSVDDQGTDDEGDDVTIPAATIAAALTNVTAGSTDVAAPFSFVPGLETSDTALRNGDGDQLFTLLTDSTGLFNTGTNANVPVALGLTPGDQVSSGQISDFADEIEALNDDMNNSNDVTFSAPLTETQTVGTPAFDVETLGLEDLQYIGAFAPSETVDNNWAAGWTKPGTVFSGDVADNCPAGTVVDGQIGDSLVCAITGNITSDLTLAAFDNVLYRVDGQVFVGTDGGSEAANTPSSIQATLTIEEGVTVFGNSPTDGLVITRGSQLVADGSANAPVVFTSGPAVRGEANYATDTAQWLGISINGKAPINNCNSDSATPGTADCEDDGEASSGIYGGDVSDDDSGVLDYVRVEFSGIFFTEEDQSNGIAFQGVGSDTDINFLQVHNNGDDGIEFFGGTADAKNVVITGANDDAVDWTDGWTGRIQFLIVEHTAGSDYGFEGDNRSTSAPDTTPRSMPRIANYTILGFNDETPGARFREGMGGDFVNGIIVDTSKGFDIDDRSNDLLLGTSDFDPNVPATVPTDTLDIDGVFLSTAENIDDDDANVAAVLAAITNETQGTDGMTGFSFYGNANRGVVPSATEASAPSVDPTGLNSGGETFFEAANYLGAVENSNDDWYLGWTVQSDGTVTSAN